MQFVPNWQAGNRKWQADCGDIQGLAVQVQSLGRFTSIRFIVYEPGRFTLAAEEWVGGGAHRLLLTYVYGGKCHQTTLIPHTTSVLFFLPQGKWRPVLWRHSTLTSALETAMFRSLRTSNAPRDLYAASKRTSFTGSATCRCYRALSKAVVKGTLQVRMLRIWKAHDNRSWYAVGQPVT